MFKGVSQCMPIVGVLYLICSTPSITLPYPFMNFSFIFCILFLISFNGLFEFSLNLLSCLFVFFLGFIQVFIHLFFNIFDHSYYFRFHPLHYYSSLLLWNGWLLKETYHLVFPYHLCFYVKINISGAKSLDGGFNLLCSFSWSILNVQSGLDIDWVVAHFFSSLDWVLWLHS
jgi:hypothetical protein